MTLVRQRELPVVWSRSCAAVLHHTLTWALLKKPSFCSCLTRVAAVPYYFPTSGFSLAQAYKDIAASHTSVPLVYSLQQPQ